MISIALALKRLITSGVVPRMFRLKRRKSGDVIATAVVAVAISGLVVWCGVS
jgi:hypothetical protein